MINVLLIFATIAIGFGGAPWAAFAIGSTAMVVLGIPAQRDVLQRHVGQPVTDIILAIVFKAVLAVGGAFASAWAGYGLRQIFLRLQA